MIRGTRRAFQSARQIVRASKSKNGRRQVHMLLGEESVIGGRQRHAFGRSTTSDTIAKALATAVAGLPSRQVLDALNLLVADLTAEDDDGR
ncbi:hypothetical protein Poli38472_001726 [Pythium oligandrum]|uniref:Uncharacterized protein n=1 Tax=Pythium oligandrum TaxID=41045 RepID=A0A8K1FMN8_PYTOL|nr:hypothetical protein Poli38472_001726 [Pythium oligandrum]|eukprot:TMW69570.1 hypothetical protein Poli38472_001726 [Pythium oligandrum]